RLTVDAGDAAATTEPTAELLHGDFEPERVSRVDDALEAAVIDPGKEADPLTEAGLLCDVDGHRLGERLDLQHPGHDRQAWEVALKEPFARGHALDGDDPLG